MVESPAHEPVKQLQSKSFPFAVSMRILQRMLARVGATSTPTVALHPRLHARLADCRELVRPIQRSITRSQLVLSVSESPSTIDVIVSTRATIAIQPNLGRALREVVRNDPTLADCTATTPRSGFSPSWDGVNPSRL